MERSTPSSSRCRPVPGAALQGVGRGSLIRALTCGLTVVSRVIAGCVSPWLRLATGYDLA
jgi:hypothetical protein